MGCYMKQPILVIRTMQACSCECHAVTVSAEQYGVVIGEAPRPEVATTGLRSKGAGEGLMEQGFLQGVERGKFLPLRLFQRPT